MQKNLVVSWSTSAPTRLPRRSFLPWRPKSRIGWEHFYYVDLARVINTPLNATNNPYISSLVYMHLQPALHVHQHPAAGGGHCAIIYAREQILLNLYIFATLRKEARHFPTWPHLAFMTRSGKFSGTFNCWWNSLSRKYSRDSCGIFWFDLQFFICSASCVGFLLEGKSHRTGGVLRPFVWSPGRHRLHSDLLPNTPSLNKTIQGCSTY